MSEFTIQRIISDLYAEEVNCGLSTSWDGGLLAWFDGNVHAPKEYASFSVGDGRGDYATWDVMWTGVLRWFASCIVERHANLEDGAPMEVGCLDCTMNTTPVDLTTGPCLYHLARDFLAGSPASPFQKLKTQEKEMKIWSCKIGECDAALLPEGADAPMRAAVERAYRELTGFDAAFNFSGWGAELDEPERAVVENREPSEERYRNWLIQQAAPDLYEALSGILAMVEDMAAIFPIKLDDEGLSAMDRARAALAKAGTPQAPRTEEGAQ